jgi:catechol 2,3-dioxygenase-like lactoylglutathione lyase family enzyme
VPTVTAVELTPILNVSDFEASVAWFEKVGFRPGFRWSAEPGAPATFGAVLWGEIEIFLCLGAQGGRGDDGAWMSIFVDDVDAVHERCARAGLDVIRPPANEPWGVREFHLRHPDGHVLRIGTGTGDG